MIEDIFHQFNMNSSDNMYFKTEEIYRSVEMNMWSENNKFPIVIVR